MTNKSPVLEAVENINESFETFKKQNDSKQAEFLDRLEQVEAASNRPPRTTGSESDTERRLEGIGLYVKGMGLQDQDLKAKGEKLLLEKAAIIGTDTAGGNTVSTVIGDEIFAELRKEPGIFDLVRVTQIDTAPASYNRVVSTTETDSGWVAEAGSRTETQTPGFNVADFTGGMLYSYPKVSEELLNSSVFNIAEFVLDEARSDFRSAIAQAIISGNGTAKPTGLTNATLVSTADDASPRRAFNVLQYLPTGDADNFQTEAYAQTSPQTDPMAVFWNCMAALRSQYRKNAVWVMNSNTLAALGKLRDVDGKSLFSPNVASSVPMGILGYPIVIDEYMADLGSNTFPVFFGDFSAGYEIVSNFETRLTVDEISTKGYTSYYLRSYLGGCVTRGEAVKAIKCAVS